MAERITNVWEVYNGRKNDFFLDMDEDTYFNIFQYYDFDGRRISDDWKAITVSLVKKSLKGMELKPTDMPYLGRGYFAVNHARLKELDRLCGKNYEKLELICDAGDYTLINVVNVIDCLELQQMKYRVYKGDPESIQKIENFVFKKSKVEKEILFKIKNYSIGHIFCTDTFKHYIEERSIPGLTFEHIWAG